MDHVLLAEQFPALVVLDVVIGEDAREFSKVSGDQGAIAIFEKLQDLLLITFHFPSLSPALFFGVLLVYKLELAQEDSVIRMCRPLALLLFVTVTLPILSRAQAAPATSDKPFVVEYYYKTKWGHADEFLRLFKKNHYPLLKKEVEMGRMVKVWMDQPRYHTTEDGRWDYRVTIMFKNSTVANEPFEEDALKKQLWPDQAAYEREEQRRFEILDAHWDLPVKTLDLEK